MAVDVETTADNMVTMLTAMTTPLFDDVWLGGPRLLPMGDQKVATVQAVNEDNFDETVCPTHYTEQALFYIHVEIMGTVEVATKAMYAAAKNVKDAVKATPTFMGGCNGSTVVGVNYGEMAGSGKHLTAVGRVEVLCDYSY